MGVWIHKDMFLSRMQHLEDQTNAIVALKIGYPHMVSLPEHPTYYSDSEINSGENSDEFSLS